MPIQALRADASHIEKIAPLFDAYRGFYGQPSNLPQSRAFIAERIARDESVIFYAEDASGETLGFVQMFQTFSSIDAHRTWLLGDLFTTPAARGKGVGTLLMNTARDFARLMGAKGMTLETATNNHSAQGLYESLGWVRDPGYYTYCLDLTKPPSAKAPAQG
ncbi:GNAT family N-acetyltransferase [Pseudomonas izuensis]|uniref:GNAT family N-acetyltransferase n=1 Tax=Pseudomonas izuensis TaxID=2684212 RepID=UPI0013574FA8|nr:GNAT family N-acetyltransferase [Pseudomonas izuensis]